jgi:diadenosine tetraphosphate (Ap4A) HIT family hydrolase
MPESPEQFYARVQSHAGPDGRLPPPAYAEWADVFPFEPGGVQMTPLRAPQPEPPRSGVGGAGCAQCAPDAPTGVWQDDTWRLRPVGGDSGVLIMMLEPHRHADLTDLTEDEAAALGRLTVHVARAIEALPHIARAQVMRIGDGAEHLHVWFFARPSRQLQLRGSFLVVWDDALPALPDDVRQADARAIAGALADSYGGRVNP